MATTRTNTDEDCRRALARCSLFAFLSEEERQQIVAYARMRRCAASETIFLKGSPGESMMAVLSGDVRISVPSADGKEIVLTVIHPGEVFGELALLDGKPRTADATALSACELAVLERRDVLPFLRQQPGVALKLLEMLCDRLRRTTDAVEESHFLQLSTRLARTLLRVAGRRISASGAPMLHVRLSQRELGAMTGGARESVNKYLGEWQRRGVVEVKGGVIVILDPPALQEIATAGS